MRHFFCLCIFLSVYIILNHKVYAQYDPSATASLGMGYGYNAMSQSVMTNAFKGSTGKMASKSSDADYIYLGLSDYSRFEEQVLSKMMEKNKGSDKSKMKSFLSKSRTMHQFTVRSKEFGLKTTYLSDILATGIAWNWEMYHQTKATKQKVINLRNAIKNNMVNDNFKSQLEKLSDADKRKWILSFMYDNSMLAQTIKQTGNLSALQKQQLALTAKQAGVPDIASVSLK